VEVFALCRKTNKKWPCCHFIAKSENFGKNQVNSRASGEAQVYSACTASSAFSPSFNGRLFSPFLLLPHQLQRVPRATEQAAASSSSLLARVSGCLSVWRGLLLACFERDSSQQAVFFLAVDMCSLFSSPLFFLPPFLFLLSFFVTVFH
jgi:hypothetical protein